eukprot:10894523-Alexandrium_andersonii.AAC.1
MPCEANDSKPQASLAKADGTKGCRLGHGLATRDCEPPQICSSSPSATRMTSALPATCAARVPTDCSSC